MTVKPNVNAHAPLATPSAPASQSPVSVSVSVSVSLSIVSPPVVEGDAEAGEDVPPVRVLLHLDALVQEVVVAPRAGSVHAHPRQGAQPAVVVDSSPVVVDCRNIVTSLICRFDPHPQTLALH